MSVTAKSILIFFIQTENSLL